MPHECQSPPVVELLTENGTRYRIDEQRMEMRRITGDSETSQELRRDGDTIRILQIMRMDVGHGGDFILEPLGHPELTSFTHRSTTPIRSINPLLSNTGAEQREKSSTPET